MLSTKHLHQANRSIKIILNTIPFIIENSLWKGVFKQKLILIFSAISAIVIPYSLISFLADHFRNNASDDSIATNEAGAIAMGNNLTLETISDGGNIYLAMILIQMIVVYFSNKTIEHLSGTVIHMSIREMISSQIRVIVVSLRNWFLQLFIGILISIVIGIFGPSFLKAPLTWFVQCYFVGYLFLDNYNFTFGMSIANSRKVISRHIAAATIVGFVANVLFLLPIVGFIFASFICSVAATYYMHTSEDAQLAQEAFINN